jgi:hypothetical protein
MQALVLVSHCQQACFTFEQGYVFDKFRHPHSTIEVGNQMNLHAQRTCSVNPRIHKLLDCLLKLIAPKYNPDDNLPDMELRPTITGRHKLRGGKFGAFPIAILRFSSTSDTWLAIVEHR